MAFKIFLAGAITWVASVFSFNAIFEWTKWPWSFRAEDDLVLLCILPPLVLALGFTLFKWAIGESFVSWLTNNKPTIGSLVIFTLISVATFNAVSASSNAEDASDMASEAASMASEAADMSRNAEIEASSAKIACKYRL